MNRLSWWGYSIEDTNNKILGTYVGSRLVGWGGGWEGGYVGGGWGGQML